MYRHRAVRPEVPRWRHVGPVVADVPGFGVGVFVGMVDFANGKRLVAVFTEPAAKRHQLRVVVAAKPGGKIIGHQKQNIRPIGGL